jgi:hypothetical protein
LYATFFLKNILDKPLSSFAIYNICSDVIETLLNNISMANLLVCFLIIQSPLNSLTYNIKQINAQFARFLNNKSLIFKIVIGFSMIHLFALLTFTDLSGKPTSKPPTIEQRLEEKKNPSTAETTSIQNETKEMTPSEPAGTKQINLAFKILSGIFNCFSLALLIARLDSKIINIPSNLISVLVLYAALQPLYVFFDDSHYATLILIVSTFALLFKVYFYLIVAYIINTGRLTDLFLTFPLIKKLIEEKGYKKNAISIMPTDFAELNRHLNVMCVALETTGYRGRKYRKIMRQSVSEGNADKTDSE